MIKTFSAVIFIIFFTFLTASRCICFPEEEFPESISIVSYNVCNLFDSSDNGTEYPEYDPSGGEWNRELYLLKLNNISAVISSIDNCGIILLQEIENRKVLEDLASGILKNHKFKYIEAAEKGDSAITTGILSRFPVSETKNHALSTSGSTNLRNIFEARIEIGNDSLYLFNNHWKSKLGGSVLSEKERILAASVINRRIRELLKSEPEADIIIAGDLNENIDEYERVEKSYLTALFPDAEYKISVPQNLLFYSDKKEETGFSEERYIFFSPWTKEGSGSYYYRNTWETIDHFFIGSNLFDSKGYRYTSFRVSSEPFFTNMDGSPFKWETYRKSGYSDHFPIVITLEKSGSK